MHRMKFWGTRGAFWGGLWGLLFGSALVLILGIAPLIVFGPRVGWLVGALEGAVVVGGLSALGAGLYSIGIPTDSIVGYETALKSDKFLVMAHGRRGRHGQAYPRDDRRGTHHRPSRGIDTLTCCDDNEPYAAGMPEARWKARLITLTGPRRGNGRRLLQV